MGLFPRKSQPRNETLGTFPTKSNPRSEVFWDSSPENERERGVSGIFPRKTRRIPNFPALFPPKRAEIRSSRGFLAPDPTKIPFPFPSLSPPPPRGGFASSRWENSPFSAPKSPFFAPKIPFFHPKTPLFPPQKKPPETWPDNNSLLSEPLRSAPPRSGREKKIGPPSGMDAGENREKNRGFWGFLG